MSEIDPTTAFDEPSTDESQTTAAKKPGRRKPAAKKPAATEAAAAPAKPVDDRVTIILEEGPSIPPNGQFIGHNGKGYILKPGVKVSVPRCVLNVLNDAVEMRPQFDGNGVIIGYREALRLPYRIVND